eukprot:426953_1
MSTKAVATLLLILFISGKASKPNILFILADDFGWANVGYHNKQNDEIKTPNMDYLVKNGLELNRHYVHYVCSPTRSSVQSGRLPVHCNLSNSMAFANAVNGVPPNYTCIAERIKNDGNYTTHFIGKWDAGSTMKEQLPHGRGYDTSFGYLNHQNDYWNESLSEKNNNLCDDQQVVDLWETSHPANTSNNTGIYEEFLFAQHVYKHIDDAANNPDVPFFIFYASHISHNPNEVPKQYLTNWDNDEDVCSQIPWEVYPGFDTSVPSNYHCRSITQSQVNLLDIIIGNITSKLKTNGQWNNTLIVFSADNGGPEYLNAAASNNFPLRGGKKVPFEGGIRVNAFVSGGFLPESRRGKIEHGILHITDWYATFAHLVGFDPTDERAAKAGLPPIDALDMWPLVSGKNSTSPRVEVPIDEYVFISGDYKYIVNTSVDYASWGGPVYPNSSSPKHPIEGTKLDCEKGCLFNIGNDMTEHKDVINENQDIAQKMDKRFNELKKGYYSNNEPGKPMCPKNIDMSCQCWAAMNLYGGFCGPYNKP